MGLEQGKDPGHRSKDRDALAADGFNEAGCNQAALEVDLGAEDGGNPQAHGLAEDVAERQRVEEAQGVDVFLVAQVGLGSLHDGVDAGEDVAVRVNDALWVAGGAGGEEDLERCVAREAGNRAGFFDGER